jgi:tetratricopeptide (TPR) repeat protein
MTALRELAGDVPIALGMSIVDCVDSLRAGLRIAESLGDRLIEADMLGRLAVIAMSRLRFVDAVELGRRAERIARASGEPRVLAIALDGLKTAYAYLGEIEQLRPVLDELEPLLRRDGDLWRLPWVVAEGAFPAMAAGRWDEAIARMQEALALNRRSGYVAYEGWFIGTLGWLHRLDGDLETALQYARRALELTEGSTHSWWRAAACAQAATTMLAASGDPDEAIALLEEGRALAERGKAESYLLQCLAPLAEATGSPELLSEADEMVREIQLPPGSAWVLGADVYHAIARAWLAAGHPDRAAAVLDPFCAAAARAGWPWLAQYNLEKLGQITGGAGRPVVAHRPV